MTAAAPNGLSAARIEDLTRVMLRPLATPLPLGFLALAIGSCLLSALQLGWISPSTTPQVALAVLTLVVPLELIAAVFAFLIRDVVMATGLGLLTGSWAAFGTLLLAGRPGGTSPVVGILAICVAVALLVPAAAASWSKPVAAAIMAVASARFALTGVFELDGGPAWKTTTGVLGVVLLATAAYGSLALALEDARHRAVLPIKRRSTSHYAMSGQLGHQLESLPTEAGVRQES
jgi:hypothetical protein